jgi:hypothetical protein
MAVMVNEASSRMPVAEVTSMNVSLEIEKREL